ncbi:MAG TPA: extracellular solute-binding protein, partial [Blastocatellia bacterium]|nr:extracellular solute-binding protein [Blastocatellia bacterium]
GTYLIPSRIHLSGVFYNRQVFERLGLGIPASEGEFEALLEGLKRRGQMPLALSGDTGEQLLHSWYALVNNRLESLDRPPAEVLDALFAGRPTISFDSPPFRLAAEKLREWAGRGYFPRDYQRLSAPEAFDRFLDGEAALYLGLGGSWAQDRAQLHPPQFVIGFFPFPPATPGARATATGAPTGVWQVFKGPRQERAVELIDWMLNPEIVPFMLQSQNLPALRVDGVRGLSLAPHVADELAALERVELGIFYDNASPSLRSEMRQGLRRVVEGEMPARRFLAEVEAAFQQDR